MAVNLVKLASQIAKSEGLRKQTSIGNVREIMKLIFQAEKKMTVDELANILKRY